MLGRQAHGIAARQMPFRARAALLRHTAAHRAYRPALPLCLPPPCCATAHRGMALKDERWFWVPVRFRFAGFLSIGRVRWFSPATASLPARHPLWDRYAGRQAGLESGLWRQRLRGRRRKGRGGGNVATAAKAAAAFAPPLFFPARRKVGDLCVATRCPVHRYRRRPAAAVLAANAEKRRA